MLAIRLPPEIERRLADLAKASGRTKTFYALEAIKRHLDRLEASHAESAPLNVRAFKGVHPESLSPGTLYSQLSVELMGAIYTELPAASAQTAAEWIAAQQKPIHPPHSKGDGKVTFTVSHVAADGVVVAHGRAMAIYPVPTGLALQVGDKVVIGPMGELLLPHVPEQGTGNGVDRG